MVDCGLVHPTRLIRTFVLKDAELARKVKELVYNGQKLLLIVVLLRQINVSLLPTNIKLL